MTAAPLFGVSVKGVVFVAGRVVLLRNERAEWELPGGRLEAGEEPVDCLRREIAEELAIAVAVERVLDCWLYRVRSGVEVVIVTYGCRTDATAVRHSAEHDAVGLFGVDELAALPMPEGYRRSVRDWRRLSAPAASRREGS